MLSLFIVSGKQDDIISRVAARSSAWPRHLVFIAGELFTAELAPTLKAKVKDPVKEILAAKMSVTSSGLHLADVILNLRSQPTESRVLPMSLLP